MSRMFLHLGDTSEPFTHGVALTQQELVVVEEHHADDLGAVLALFKLGKDQGRNRQLG